MFLPKGLLPHGADGSVPVCGFRRGPPHPTLLPGLVEHLDVLQLHADARPELHGVRGVVLAASLYGAVCVSSNDKHRENKRINQKQDLNGNKNAPNTRQAGLGIMDHIPEGQPLAGITGKS